MKGGPRAFSTVKVDDSRFSFLESFIVENAFPSDCSLTDTFAPSSKLYDKESLDCISLEIAIL